MALFAASKKADLLRSMLALEHDAPSHDTFSRVMRLLDPVADPAKGSIRLKVKKTGWQDHSLLNLLSQMP